MLILIVYENIVFLSSFFLFCSSFDRRQLGRTFFHIRFPHSPKLGKELEVSLSVFVEILLNNQSSLIKTSCLHIQNVMTEFEILHRFLISVQHHQTTPDIVLKDSIVNWLNLKTKTVHYLCFFKTTEGIFKFFHMIETNSNTSIGMRSRSSLQWIKYWQILYIMINLPLALW